MDVTAARLQPTGQISVADSTLVLGKEFTIEAWLCFEPGDNDPAWACRLFNGLAGGEPVRFIVNMSSPRELGLCFSCARVELILAPVQLPHSTLPPSTWIHLAAVRSAKTLALLRNGAILWQEKPLGQEPTPIVVQPNYMLADCSGFPVGAQQRKDGPALLIADFRIWTRAVAADELASRKLGVAPAKSEGLLRSWSGDAERKILADNTGKDFKGTLLGPATIVTRSTAAPPAAPPASPSPPASPAPPVSPTLSSAVPQGPAAPRPLLDLDPSGVPTLLKYQLPESTSYRGRNVIELPIPVESFVFKPSATLPKDSNKQVGQPSAEGKEITSAPPTSAPPGTGLLVNKLDAYRQPVDPTGRPLSRQFGRPAPPQPSRAPASGSPASDNPSNPFEGALSRAKTTGFLDPKLFPLMAGAGDAMDLQGVRTALEKISVPEVAAILGQGTHDFAVYRDTTGEYKYRFVRRRVIDEPRPTMLLIEQYRLSSFLGQYGAGRTIKTFSLLPGERTTVYIRSYKANSKTMQRASSILDSATQEAEREFELTTQNEQTSQDNIDSSFEYHAQLSVTGSATWGWGDASVSASGGIAGSTNAARELFAKNMSNAVQQHADRASSYREVSVVTSFESHEESSEEQWVERQLTNLNVSRTLNFAFRQMNQEYITVLHLTDVRVAYFNGYRESRDEVALHDLDKLLETYVTPEKRATVRQAVQDALMSTVDFRDVKPEAFFLTNQDGTLRVNRAFKSTFNSSDGSGPPITVPGVIVGVDTHIMRTDAVVVDSFLGQGDALDAYSHGLQEESLREQRLANDQRALQVELMREALDAVRAGSTERAQRLSSITGLIAALAAQKQTRSADGTPVVAGDG